MKIITRTSLMLPVFLFATITAAAAQQAPTKEAPAKLQTGTWTGSVTPPGENTVNITLEVTDGADGPAITIVAGEHGSFKAENIKVEADRFTFSFVPGPVVTCVLSKQPDATYAGDCSHDAGESARMTVTPPKAKS